MEVTASRTRRPLLEAPDTVLLGVASREPLPERAAPGDVKTSDDLPTRLFFGDLDRDSFRRTDNRWTADYGDPEHTGTHLTWHGTILEMKNRFEGSEVTSWAKSVEKAAENLLRSSLQMFTPGLQTLARRHGALFAPAPEGAYYIGGFPEGPLATLLVPLHPVSLPNVVDWFHDTVRPSGVTCFGAALRWTDETYYRKGAAPDIERDIDFTPQQALQEGALAAYTTILTGRNNSDLFIRRILYGLELHVPYRDLDFVLSSLSEAGLSRQPDAPAEWRPVILPTVVALTAIDRELQLVRTDDRQTTAWLPPSEWTWKLKDEHLRDAAWTVAVMIQSAWMREVALLDNDAPPLARVVSPGPPYNLHR